MKKPGYSVIVPAAAILLFGGVLFGCATSRDAESSTPPRERAGAVDESEEGDMEAAADLGRTLSAAVGDPSQWGSLHLQVECVGDDGMRSAEVYGSGVGIWDYRRQFTLTPEEVSSLLRTLEKAGFTSFEEIYGGKKEEDSSIRVTCRVVLSLAGQTKQVAQLAKGEQSAELKRLADELLAACEKPGQAGTAAADLTDGLGKVSRGELAPEAFHVLLHRKPEKAADGGFLLRLSGLRATDRGYDEAGFLDPVGLTLSRAEVAELAGELAGLRLAQLPINLYALDYTDLSVDVLIYKKSVQARQFAQMTPTTHGEHQADFERIYDALYQLHLRVQSEGAPGEED